MSSRGTLTKATSKPSEQNGSGFSQLCTASYILSFSLERRCEEREIERDTGNARVFDSELCVEAARRLQCKGWPWNWRRRWIHSSAGMQRYMRELSLCLCKCKCLFAVGRRCVGQARERLTRPCPTETACCDRSVEAAAGCARRPRPRDQTASEAAAGG